MNVAPHKTKPPHVGKMARLRRGSRAKRTNGKHSAPRPIDVIESFAVIVIRDGGRRVEWSRADRERAEGFAARLRQIGMDAVVERAEVA